MSSPNCRVGSLWPYAQLIPQCKAHQLTYYLCSGDPTKTLSYGRWDDVRTDTKQRILQIFGQEALNAFEAAERKFPTNQAHQWLNFYTWATRFFKDVNERLRELNELAIDECGNEIRALRLAMLMATDCHLRPTPGQPITLYRKVKVDQPELMVEEFERHKGMPFIFPAFTSTSRNATVFDSDENPAPVVLIFEYQQIPNDDMENIAFPVDISQISEYQSEAEVLLPCFSSFRVREIKKDIDCRAVLCEKWDDRVGLGLGGWLSGSLIKWKRATQYLFAQAGVWHTKNC